MNTRPPMLRLPIDDVIADVQTALASAGIGILVAPPGAGKTTRVPLALLDAPWRDNGRILVLEPRRIAARAAAEHMAKLLGESVGQTVGLRARLATKVSSATRVEVVTEGVFTRMIIDDPELKGVAAVLFDEFHERSLDADLGLTLARDTRAAFRPDLRLLIMSATLDSDVLAVKLDGCPVVRSEGRSFPIETRYVGRAQARIEDKVVEEILRATRQEHGSMLVFLPGQAEIRRVATALPERMSDANIEVHSLYGAMPPGEQDRAIAPVSALRRKIVLATAIAETSLTIEGVRVVIDSGLSRIARYDAEAGLSRLDTVRVSRASADQRRGRAGRIEPGVCIRLWDEPETQGLLASTQPEIFSADLSTLVLDCAAWGAPDPTSLPWLEPPPAGSIASARQALMAIDAIDEQGQLTPLGRQIRALPMPPRLARMLLVAGRHGHHAVAAEIAALVVERGVGGNDVDLDHRHQRLQSDRSRRAADVRRMARTWAETAARLCDEPAAQSGAEPASMGAAEILSWAYPERMAKARGGGQFLLANGRAGQLDTAHPLSTSPYLVVAELQGRAAAPRIVSAAACDEATFVRMTENAIEVRDEVFFDATLKSVRARTTRRLGAIVLSEATRPLRDDDETSGALASGVMALGVDRLPWSKTQQQFRARIAFLARAGSDVPDLSDAALTDNQGAWLIPFLDGKTRSDQITADVLARALSALVPWDVAKRLEIEVPTHFVAPTGEAHVLDYASDGAPVLAIRVQQLFGLKEHPAIAGGKLPLTLHLLSPAHRPIQITNDLPRFWAGSWQSVRSEMRGRYPKHVWPDDPANAAPTTRAKPRSR